MHSTGKKLTILACVLAVGGCADAASVTAPPRSGADSPAAFDGGGWFGTGNRSDSTSTPPQQQSEPQETADGGGWFGTGN